MNLLDYYRNDQTEQMVQRWGERLEQMDIRDKLDAIWAIATNVGHCEQTNELKTLTQTQDEYGGLLEECPDSETFLTLLETSNPSINDLFAVMACLSAHLHGGLYRKE
jgi:hypothetical protein